MVLTALFSMVSDICRFNSRIDHSELIVSFDGRSFHISPSMCQTYGIPALIPFSPNTFS